MPSLLRFIFALIVLGVVSWVVRAMFIAAAIVWPAAFAIPDGGLFYSTIGTIAGVYAAWRYYSPSGGMAA